MSVGLNRVWGYALDRPDLTPAPGATIDVYQKGTTTHVPLYADSAAVTPLANPFTADADAYYDFYTAPQRIDVRISGTGITTPYTLGDVQPLPPDPSDEINVRSYGAKLDGVTDDTAAFNALIAAINLAGGNATIYVPTGTAALTAALTPITVSNVKWRGDGSLASILSWPDTAVKGIQYSGAIPQSTANISVAIDIGAHSFTAGAGQGAQFAVGNWLYFLPNGALGLDSNGTFITRVAGIVGDVITTEDLIPCAYTTSDTVPVYASTAYLEGVEIAGLGFACTTSSPASKLTHIQLSRCHRARITACRVVSAAAPLITLVQNRDTVVSLNDLELSTTGAACGCEVQASTGTLLLGNVTRRTRFGLTFTNSPRTVVSANHIEAREPVSGGGGRGIRGGGQSNFSAITGNDVNDTGLYGIYLQSTSFSVITGNSVFGVGFDDLEHGIQVGAGATHPEYMRYNAISGNQVAFCTGYGIIFNADDTQLAYPTYNAASGNNVSNCVHGAILFRSSYCSAIGNHVSSPANAAADIGSSATTVYNHIHGNHITRPGATGNDLFPAINTSGSGGLNTVTGNKVSPTSVLGFPIPINTNATDTTDKSLVTPYLLLRPTFNHTQVATGANTTEIDAWRLTIPANTFYDTQCGAQLTAYIRMANNVNLKTVRLYVGNLTFTGVTILAGGPFTITLLAEFFYTGVGAVFAGAQYISDKISLATGNGPGASSGNGAIDWTVDNDIVITLQNGVANANDIIFSGGAYVPQGIPATTGSLP